MKKNNVRLVFDRRKKAASRGVGEVELYVYLTREENKYLHVCTLNPEDYYAYSQSIEARQKIESCQSVIDDMILAHEPMTIDVFTAKFVSLKTKKFVRRSVLDYISDLIDQDKNKASTKRNKHITLDALAKFGKIQSFEDLTVDNLRLFDKWLHRDNLRTDVTVHNYHKHFMKWTRMAYEDNLIPDDPYNRVHFPRGQTKEREPLTEEELIKLRELPLTGHLAHARDLFIFSAYTGLAFCDVIAFDYRSMTEEIDGQIYIDGSRLKTGNKFFTPILEPAMRVLEAYNYRLHTMSNMKVNDYLHSLEPRIGITKPLTFHIARHSFATLCLSLDVPIDKVARMLGHKDIRTTQIYAKILKSAVAKHSQMLAASIR